MRGLEGSKAKALLVVLRVGGFVALYGLIAYGAIFGAASNEDSFITALRGAAITLAVYAVASGLRAEIDAASEKGS